MIKFCKINALSLLLLLSPSAEATTRDLFDWSWHAGFDDAAGWMTKPTWVSGASEAAKLQYDGVSGNFIVPEAGRGMKWYLPIDPVVYVPHSPWMVIKYRADSNFNTKSSGYFIYLDDGQQGIRSAWKCSDVINDGQWHESAVRIDKIVESKTLSGVGLQLQAGKNGGSTLRIASLRLSTVNPLLEIKQSNEGGATGTIWKELRQSADFSGYRALALPQGNSDASKVLRELPGLQWPEWTEASVAGIPFELPTAQVQWPATGILQTGVLEVVVGERASEVGVMLAALLRGAEEEVYARNKAVYSISQLSRFMVRVEYADGTFEDSFPYNLTTGSFELRNGMQIVNIFTDPAKKISRLLFYDRTDRAALVLMALTLRSGARFFSEFDEENLPLDRFKPSRRRQSPVQLTVRDGILNFGPCPQGRLDIKNLPHWLELNDLNDRSILATTGQQLFMLELNGTKVPAPKVVLDSAHQNQDAGWLLRYRIDDQPELGFEIEIDPELRFSSKFINHGKSELNVSITGPDFGTVALDSAADDYYVFPGGGWHYHTRPVKLTARYGGQFPLQFAGVFSGSEGSGMWLETRSTTGGMWDYGLQKSDVGTRLWLVNPERVVPGGTEFKGEPARLRFGGGDWHEAFEDYVSWISSWRKPRTQRPLWFREVFNFRQHYLHRHDALYDAKSQRYNLNQAVIEGKQHFGGIDYLHLFDWGSVPGPGRVYGRVGDYSPYEYLGGCERFRAAIKELKDGGTPVGLYIEGYLISEKSKIATAHGPAWQIMSRDGSMLCYPNSSEMMMCPWVESWRELQAASYRQKVSELDVDGMYMDQFGFANPWKDCWSREHGHPVPGNPMQAEMVMAEQIRAAIETVKSGVALYGEETPPDIAMQFQDGSFSYHMLRCQRTRPLAPVNLTRFADPSFKAFQLLHYVPRLGTWSEGIEWTFFNGDGIWLKGRPDWYAPLTKTTIRKCHSILRTHRDAFCSLDVQPLVPTEAGGIYANRFAVQSKTVYTLYNARHRTYHGVVLELTAEADCKYYDAWRKIDLTPRSVGQGRVLVEMSIAPRGVSCLVITNNEEL